MIEDIGLPLGWYLIPPPTQSQINQVLREIVAESRKMISEREMRRTGSLGAQRVRESFNPSGHELVDKIKRYTADLIDLCNDGNENTNMGTEEKRLWALAMTHYEDAAMWAVKAATTEKKP